MIIQMDKMIETHAIKKNYLFWEMEGTSPSMAGFHFLSFSLTPQNILGLYRYSARGKSLVAFRTSHDPSNEQGI